MAPTIVDRRTVDLSAYPDLVVIYLGMRVLARDVFHARRDGSDL